MLSVPDRLGAQGQIIPSTLRVVNVSLHPKGVYDFPTLRVVNVVSPHP
jgi:hypothetical protein